MSNNYDFINTKLSLHDYVSEIVRSYKEISKKEFLINSENYKNPINTNKSLEIIYGLRNIIENVNKISNGLQNNEHSGATFGYCMRLMQAIAKQGFTEWNGAQQVPG